MVLVKAPVGLVAPGRTSDEILAAHPHLEAEDIRQAPAYAACGFEEIEVPFPASSSS